MYTYRATYIRNYDGDTITFLVDLGFGIHKKTTVRLAGIDTPELRSSNLEEKAKAKEAKSFVEQHLIDSEIVIKTQEDKTGKYGRYLADVYVDGNLKSLNRMLIEEGLAEKY